MSGMKGFHISASGAIQGHHGPLVFIYDRVENIVGKGENAGFQVFFLRVVKSGLCEKEFPKFSTTATALNDLV